ncbi:MAG: nitroreductase family protein [Deltaproteobacteria bacterium]|nr:nitroreductase family protein [Deltaproteobacteria bacterium]
MIKDLITKNRSYRRFHQDFPVGLGTLKELVDLARLSASAANKQPLKYILSCDPDRNTTVFSNLAWAASLKDWPGPSEGERPSAYIIMLGDKGLSNPYVKYDVGIAAQSILLGATEKGLGGCMIASVKRDRLREKLAIPDSCEILLVVALGKPKEDVVIEDAPPSGDTTYWRDADGVHHVPKRPLEDIIIG